MAAERVFNIFIYFQGDLATDFGVRHHQVDGSEQQKSAYLAARLNADHPVARRFPLPRSFTSAQWRAAQRHGQVLDYFEEALVLYRAGGSPLFCLTAVIDGEPRVDSTGGPEPFRGDQVAAREGLGAMPDYLVDYVDGNSFRFTQLVHDDYFKAIRALFNARLYVSSAKLLMSCVDTLAFVEFGDVAGNFTKWLNTYVDLAPLGITSEELWEFRNSLLHMTTLASRKVVAGKVSPIMPYVAKTAVPPLQSPGMPKPFNLLALISTLAGGIGRWAETYNQDRDKLLTFIERYDLTISDSRVALLDRDRAARPDTA
jgi:hypothetical protein